MSNIFTYVSIGFAVLLVIGFLIGMLRSWKKSLIRFGILVGDFVVSLFTAPLIAKAIIKKVAQGTKIVIFNLNFDIAELIKDMAGEDIYADISGAEATTTALATGLINILVNIALFVLMFIAIWILSLIIYWIVCAIVGHVGKKERKKGEKKHVNIGLRFVGGFIGLVSTCALCFAFLIPLFGSINICNKFLEENQKQTASAYSPASTVGGRLYYTEDEKIGKIETYIEKYADIKTKYDKSVLGGFYNFTGLGKLGALSFGYLTNVKSDNLNINLTNESVAVISTYNAYKETFVEKKFDVKNNDSVDGLKSVYDKATKSEIVNSYLVELLPTLSDKWSSGEKFFGIANPLDNEFTPVFNQILQVFRVKSLPRINSNVNALFDLIKVANNNQLITSLQDNVEITEYMKNNTTLVKEAIVTLSKTEEFRNNLPTIFNELLKVVYNDVVGGENTIPDANNVQIADDGWETEANNLQGIFNTIMGLYGDVQDNTEENNVDQLGTFGKVLDLSRNSKMLGNSLKEFIIGYINSGKINFGENNTKVKDKLLQYIGSEWENAEFSFEDTFSTLAETAAMLKDLQAEGKKPNLSEMGDLLKDMVGNESSKEVLQDLLDDDEITDSLFGTDDSSKAVKDVVKSIVDGADEESLDKDIAAGQAVLDIVQESKDKGGQITDENAGELVDALSSSDTMMDLLKQASDAKDSGDPSQTTPLGEMIDKLDENTKKSIADSVAGNQGLTEDQKAIFESLFGNGTV